jgi:hypothetical protein
MNLDIVGKFGDSGTDIEGTARALLELSKRVLEIKGHEVFELNVPSVPPSPYFGYLKSLHIDLNEGNVHIGRDNESMHIRGSAEKIGILADNIASLALQESNSISLTRILNTIRDISIWRKNPSRSSSQGGRDLVTPLGDRRNEDLWTCGRQYGNLDCRIWSRQVPSHGSLAREEKYRSNYVVNHCVFCVTFRSIPITTQSSPLHNLAAGVHILTKTTANLIQQLVSIQKAAGADDMASLSTMLDHAQECALQMDRQAMALLQENGNLRERMAKCEPAAFGSAPISKLPTHGESTVPKPDEWIGRAIRSFMVS